MKNNAKDLLLVIGGLVVLLLVLFHRWMVYWLWYTPLYALFPNSLYLEFYLHIVVLLLACAGLAYLAVLNCRWERPLKKSTAAKAVVVIALGIAGAFFIGRDACRDIRFINEEKYLTAECRIETLHISRSTSRRSRVGGGRRRYYGISTLEHLNNGRPLNIRMNFYHYRQLLHLQKADSAETVTVYYLPHSRRMLKYTD